jgi:hypothetical protein
MFNSKQFLMLHLFVRYFCLLFVLVTFFFSLERVPYFSNTVFSTGGSGSVIKGSGAAAYSITDQLTQTIRRIPDSHTFAVMGYRASEVYVIPDAQLMTYKQGPPFPSLSQRFRRKGHDESGQKSESWEVKDLDEEASDDLETENEDVVSETRMTQHAVSAQEELTKLLSPLLGESGVPQVLSSSISESSNSEETSSAESSHNHRSHSVSSAHSDEHWLDSASDSALGAVDAQTEMALDEAAAQAARAALLG